MLFRQSRQPQVVEFSLFENKVLTSSESNRYRGIVTINGIEAKFISVYINTNTYYVADTFSVEIPINQQSAELSLQYFSSQAAMMVEIFIGEPEDISNFNKTNLESILLGQTDSIETKYLQNKIILTGRDLTAKFIDNKTTQKYPNLTASQIVTMLAQKEGLQADVTDTKVPAGIYYANNKATLTSELPEWDLITFLAQSEQFYAYVKDITLHFHPRPPETQKPYLLQYSPPNIDTSYFSFNGMDFSTVRNLTVARDVAVTVRSWNTSSKKAFTVKVKSSLNKKIPISKAAGPIGELQQYSYTFPGLTKEQALQKAQQIARQLTQHERVLNATLPGDNILSKLSIIKLSGTNTDYDQLYYPSSINRSFKTSGYTMDISAKNHSPNSTVEF